MTFFKTTLATVCAISTFASAAIADGHTGGPLRLTEGMVIPEIPPVAVTGGLIATFLLLASTSATSTTAK
jgi:hypothetical protein